MPSPAVSLVALICEFIGTLILVYTYAMTGANYITLGIALWVCGLIGGKISGAHINPAITIAYALRRENRLNNFPLVILYMIVQFGGGFAAGLLGWWTNPAFREAIGPRIARDPQDQRDQETYLIGQAIFLEILGSFVLTQIVLMSTEKITKLTTEDWVGWLLIGVTLNVAVSWGGLISGASYNPALGFGLSLTHLIQGDNELIYTKYGTFIWVYIAFPYIGALLALVFHQFLFKKAVKELPDPEREELIG